MRDVQSLLIKDILPTEQRRLLINKIHPLTAREFGVYHQFMASQRTDQNAQKCEDILTEVFSHVVFNPQEIALTICSFHCDYRDSKHDVKYLNACMDLVNRCFIDLEETEEILSHVLRGISSARDFSAGIDFFRDLIARLDPPMLRDIAPKLYEFVGSSPIKSNSIHPLCPQVISADSGVLPRQQEQSAVDPDEPTPFQKAVREILVEAVPHLKALFPEDFQHSASA